MKIVHYIKLNINRSEQKSDRDNYNTQQRSDLESMLYGIYMF